MANWYCKSGAWAAGQVWLANTAYQVGDVVRRNGSATAGDERFFKCTTAGTSGSTQPTWTLTKSGTTTDDTVVWTEITGQESIAGLYWYNGTTRVAITSPWEIAHATLWKAGGWLNPSGGDTLFVSHNHVEPGYTVTTDISFTGNAASPTLVLGVIESGTIPPDTLVTTPIVINMGSVAASAWKGHQLYIYGLELKAAYPSIRAADGVDSVISLNNFNINCMGGNPVSFDVGTGELRVEWNGGACKFNSSAAYMRSIGSVVTARHIKVEGTTLPASLIKGNTGRIGIFDFFGCDFSALAPGKSLVDGSVKSGEIVTFSSCRFSSDLNLLLFPSAATNVTAYNCDSGDTNYMFAYRGYAGTIDTVTGQYLSGGASVDSQAVALRATSSATATFMNPLVIPLQPVEINTEGTAKTITVQIAQNNGATALKESECWLRVKYMGTDGNPLGAVAEDHNSTILSLSTTDQTASSATWVGLTNPTKQKLAVTITPQKPGIVECEICLAKPSTEIFVEIAPVVS